MDNITMNTSTMYNINMDNVITMDTSTTNITNTSDIIHTGKELIKLPRKIPRLLLN